MKTLSYKNVLLNSGFLHEKQQLNKNVTIGAVYDRFNETGRINAFNCNWQEGKEQKPHVFWDSDVAKWMEATSYILQKEKNPLLEARVESIIDAIEQNQSEDGYFNIYFTVCEPDKRFTDRSAHELYCAGHLFEAAVAYYEATGKDRFLKLMEKYADYIKKIFIEDKSAAFITPGHEEIELALIRLYRATGKKQYLETAAFFLNNRGSKADRVGEISEKSLQCHLPVREQKTAEGHCVRACYLYAAMADLAYETNDATLYEKCKEIFNDIVNSKMYITGGIGSTRCGEAFTVSYDLKNDKAYAETCAAIALMFFAHRMMRFENDSCYADVIERILYNGMIAGLSLSGDKFFYENPLEIDMRNYIRFPHPTAKEIYAITSRVKVFDCSCCPPNLNRVLASLGDYIYGYEDDTVYINQFAGSNAVIGNMKVTQKTDFPINNEIKIKAEGVKKLCIRIPNWCADVSINAAYTLQNGYAVIDNPNQEITIRFDMSPFLVQSNTEIYENNGKVAVCCGPFVCAAEAVNNIENLHSIYIDKNFTAKAEYSEALSGFTLKVKAFRKITDDKLYSRYNEIFEDYTLKMIPYAAFANRGDSNMCVWFNVR